MDARHDALAAAAEVVLAVERLGSRRGGPRRDGRRVVAVPERGERRPGRDADVAGRPSRRRPHSPAGDGGDSRRGRADRGRARRRRRDGRCGTTPPPSSSTRGSAGASPMPSETQGLPGPRARQRRGSRRRRPLPHLPGGDAVRPLRRRHQPRPARVGLRGGRRRSRSTSSSGSCARSPRRRDGDAARVGT